MSRRASKPTPLPRSRLDEVLRAGIGERSTPRALQPASVDVPVYTRIPTGGEPNKDYMQGMLWAQYPPPHPDTPMGRGETLYDPPKGYVPVKEEAREQWEYQLANWLVWADSRPYQGGAKAALLQFKRTFASLQRAFQRLRSNNKATRLSGAKEFLNAMFARIYHLHSADEFVLQISSILPLAASRANNYPRVTWSEVMRSAWSYYRALGAADEVVAAAQSQALAQWRRPPPDEAP